MIMKQRARELEATRIRNAAEEVRSTWPVQRWLREYADLLDSPSSLVAALIAEGGEIQEVVEKTLMYDPATSQFGEVQVLSQLWPRHGAGRYLVFPIPVESAEAKETP